MTRSPRRLRDASHSRPMTEPKHIKVLFWPGWWYPDRINPVNAIFIHRHAEAVAPLVDLAVLYVTADPNLSDRTYEIDAENDPVGLTVRVYFRPHAVPWHFIRWTNTWRYYRATGRGLREIRRRWGRPDLVHLHVSPPAGQLLALISHFPRIPFLFTEHWTGYHPANGEFRGFFRKRLTSWTVKNAFAVLPVSRNLQDVMEGRGLHGRFVVVPNSVRTDLFSPLPGKEPGRPFTFLHVSRLAPVKNVSGILRAAAELRRNRQDFRLLIVGDGEDRPGLERLAGELALGQDCVRFLGRKLEDDLAGITRQADSFVLFSDYENLPCVVAEAMACGLPVIATRVGGVPEQVHSGMGILVEPRDEEGLRRAMETMIDEADRFDRAAIRAFAEREYSHPEVGMRLLRLYREALQSSGGAE